MLINIGLYDKFKKYFLPLGDANYQGFDQLARRMIAGGFCGLFTISVTYPFDLIRTRIAADMSAKGDLRLYRTTFDCFNHATIEHGYRGLFKGYMFASLSMIP